MTPSTSTVAPSSVKAALDRANPQSLGDLFALLKFGAYLRGQGPQVLRRRVPAADAAQLGTLQSLVLPNDAKAASILRATALTGTVTGELAPQTYGTTPSSGQCAVGPNGDLVFLAADAITSVDVLYLPERGFASVSIALPVVTNVLTLPAQYTNPAVPPTPGSGSTTPPTPPTKGSPGGVILLVDANAQAGTATGRKKILVPGSGAPSAGQARLNVAKTTVTFASADAVTSAIVTLLLCTANDLDYLLESELDIP